ncbi:hypothetical protein [Phenylobacterium sp.]|jgi:hypothetical protein|uniref:hypothetical protein n=1 Tax=Phenylobacterium sp. TaxID=1871053 RepID=UPI002E37D187|nr:hypothetical protein [Phenylobacterium sp.]HEX2559585.1 hypothetical protein [Phenylobacterium sp.]
MNAPLARAAEGLSLAAAPTFAAMATATAAWGGGPMDALCGAGARSGVDGMTQMYLLMAAFHVSPWLRLAARRKR